MRYLKGTIDHKITYGGKSGITGFCDSDYAMDVDEKKFVRRANLMNLS